MLSVQAPEAALKAFTHKHPLHSLLVQLPSAFSIVGDPFSPRFDPVPHIVQSALGNLPVTVTASSTQTEPFLAIDDASRSVVQGARMLDVASSKEYLRLLGFVGEVEIVGPPSSGSNRVQAASPLAELAQTAIALIQSQSPFATIEQPRAPIASPSDARFHVSEMAHRKTASKVLGFTPTISVETALRAYVSSILRLQTTYLSSRINVACSSPPSISVLEEGLLAMNGCNIQLLTLVEGAYHTLGCSQGLEGEHDEPLSLVSAVPYKEGVRGVEITAERGLEGKVDIQMRCPVVGKDGKLVPGESEVVMWADTPTGGEFAELSREGAHEIAEWFTVDFAQRDARSFTLTLPPTEGVPEGEEPKRRLTFREPNANRKTLLFQPTGDDAARALLWKFNPICCAATERRKDVWDFFHEDPLVTSQVSYPSEDGRTTLAESTLATRKCHDLRAEHDRITKVQQRLQRGAASSTSGSRTGSSSSSGDMCRPQYGEAATWTAKDQQTCSIDCSAPIPCIASDNCKCTRDRCGDARGAGPFPSVAYTDAKSFPPVSSPPTQSLAERVAALPWDAVIVPGARDAFRLGIDQLPKAHVVSLPESVDNHLKAPACYDLDRSPLPFMGDHYFVEALRNRSVSLDEAEFVMVPYFQVRALVSFLEWSPVEAAADSQARRAVYRAATTTTCRRTRSRNSPIRLGTPRRASPRRSTSRPSASSSPSRTTLARALGGGPNSKTCSATRRRRRWIRPSPGRSTATTTRAASRPTAMSSSPPSPSTPSPSLTRSRRPPTSSPSSSASTLPSLRAACVALARSRGPRSAVGERVKMPRAPTSCTSSSRQDSGTSGR